MRVPSGNIVIQRFDQSVSTASLDGQRFKPIQGLRPEPFSARPGIDPEVTHKQPLELGSACGAANQ